MSPELVSLHAVTVIQSDRAAMGDGVEAEFSGVQGLTWPNIFSPTKGEELTKQQ